MPCILAAFLADPQALSRVDHLTMNQQSLMEVLVSGMNGAHIFKGPDGAFTAMETWEPLSCENDEVRKIKFTASIGTFPRRDVEFFLEPGGSIDFQWVPSSVTDLEMKWLQLDGTLETKYLPPGLTALLLHGNNLKGEFRIEHLPPGVQVLNIAGNRFEGTLQLSKLPRCMQMIDATSNAFSGSIDFSQLPDSIQGIDLGNNKFTGSVDLSMIPSGVRRIYLKGNLLRQQALVAGEWSLTRLYIDRESFERII